MSLASDGFKSLRALPAWPRLFARAMARNAGLKHRRGLTRLADRMAGANNLFGDICQGEIGLARRT
jgi:hypothetical protein